MPSGRVGVRLRSFPRRAMLDTGLDRLRFRLDTFPQLDYQPLPWLGLDRARRSAGTEARWAAMRPVLDEVGARSAVDVGCNVGWFSVQLALHGVVTVGVECDPKYYRTALHAARRLGLRNLGLLVLEVSRETLQVVPPADAVLYLSVWHHVVKDRGLDVASDVLEGLWLRANRVLFFETGETELPASYGLPPLTPDARTWLHDYLERTCVGATVCHLGAHPAFAPDGGPCERNLFALVRRAAP